MPLRIWRWSSFGPRLLRRQQWFQTRPLRVSQLITSLGLHAKDVDNVPVCSTHRSLQTRPNTASWVLPSHELSCLGDQGELRGSMDNEDRQPGPDEGTPEIEKIIEPEIV